MEVVLGIVLVSTLWSVVKPMPSYLPPGAERWTQNKKMKEVYGRKESLDEIAGILNMNRHALLVGPSRVGKSVTAKALPQAIERGDYPELKGKSVFRFNMADLIDQQASLIGGSNKTLSQISLNCFWMREENFLMSLRSLPKMSIIDMSKKITHSLFVSIESI